ncbi:hypothetical protein KI387_027374, partial [Taxus chinensis]
HCGTVAPSPPPSPTLVYQNALKYLRSHGIRETITEIHAHGDPDKIPQPEEV